jgi:hypothetical protein
MLLGFAQFVPRFAPRAYIRIDARDGEEPQLEKA